MVTSTLRIGFRLLAGAIAAAFFTAAPIAGGMVAPAQAQRSVSVEFRTALEPYGRWVEHTRWGEVWVPDDRPLDWRPYTVGHWVYTDDWGWYWIEDEPEAAWGLVTYHYGRWAYDERLHWVWIPGREWGPGWVQWRRGHDVIGWCPLPPEGIVAEYREDPEVWVFVRARDVLAPRVASIVIPPREYSVYIRETVVVNRTVAFSDRHYAVNPGIPAAFVAAAVGRPLRSYEVRPRVLAGTVNIPGAVEVRARELRQRNAVRSLPAEVRETRQEIRPAARIANPQPLRVGERGRLGDNPPRAAHGLQALQQGTQGRGQQPPQNERRQGRPQQEPQPGTVGRGQQPQQPPQTERRGRQPNLPGQTQGRGGGQPNQLPQSERREGRPRQGQQPGTEGRGQQPQQLPQTERRGRQPNQPGQTQGRDGGQPRQSPQGERRENPPNQGQQPGTEGRRQQPQQLPQTERRGRQPNQPPPTEGRGNGHPRQMPQSERREGPPRQAPQTEGRGGGQPRQMPQMQGHGGGQPRQMPQAEHRGGGQPNQMPQMQGHGGGQPRQMPQTEGRGGGQPRQMPQAGGHGGGGQPQPPQTQGRGGGHGGGPGGRGPHQH